MRAMRPCLTHRGATIATKVGSYAKLFTQGISMTTETPEALKARKLAHLDAVLEALAAETREVSRAFYHGWVLSAAMELWDRGVLSQEERLDIEAKVKAITQPPATE